MAATSRENRAGPGAADHDGPVDDLQDDGQATWRVREAAPGDEEALDALIHALAAYEREPDAVEGTPADLAAALFGPAPLVHAHVAEVAVGDRWEVAGIAVWFVTFSTWKARHGLWLEDLFVRPEHRRLGLGRALLAALAARCEAEGWSRFEWWVLDWNEPAHAFYRSLGARPEGDWTTWRLDGAPLAALAADA